MKLSKIMVRLRHSALSGVNRVAGQVAGAVLMCVGLAATLSAQAPVHSRHAGVMPPGAIGGLQLQRGGPIAGYIQPVEIRAPKGALISPAAEGQFVAPKTGKYLLGMLVSPVYRLKISQITGREGFEVYPTIEIIDRMYPPPSQRWRFPIPIEITQRELEMALDGKFITRVIYLEDPDRALPVPENPQEQSYFEVGLGEDPLVAADRLGRPVAILRMGGRLPGPDGPDNAFMYGSPTWIDPAPAQ